MTRSQTRLLVALVGLVAVGVLATLQVAERSLRQREAARLEASLRERAKLVGELVAGTPLHPSERERLQPLAARAARAAQARVTFLGPDGSVLADSSVPAGELPALENHAARPEVRAALLGGEGLDRRRSRSLLRPFLYLAVPGPDGGVVRLAEDLAQVDERVAELRRRIAAAGLLGLAVASAFALVLARRALRPVSELRGVVEAIVRGESDPRVQWQGPDELRDIAASVAALAEGLRLRLREVAAENEQFQAVLAGMVEAVLVVDRKDRVVLANPKLREFFRVWGDVLDRPHWEVIRRAEVEQALGAAAAAPEPVVLEITVGEPDEHVLQMHAVRFPRQGELRGIVAVFHDVTELRRLEGLRREFVANVSHELKTPLTAIRGFAETLQAEGVAPEQRTQYVAIILRHAERLGRLIEDLLELSRIEGRRAGFEPTPLDVARVAETLLRDLQPQLAARELRAESTLSGDPLAFADRRAVEQVLSNLLGNAIKYSDPGGRLEVRVIGRPAEVRVEVADTGIGIPAADLPRIFERFYRVDKARSRDLGGTGLGLSIVKHLVQAQGGDVFVSSVLGQGSTFVFTLPRAAAR